MSTTDEKKRESGNFDNYVQEGTGWKCKTCGGVIMAAIIYHPIWDGPFPCSGSGRVHTSEQPYCPNCETKPSSSGKPIQL